MLRTDAGTHTSRRHELWSEATMDTSSKMAPSALSSSARRGLSSRSCRSIWYSFLLLWEAMEGCVMFSFTHSNART